MTKLVEIKIISNQDVSLYFLKSPKVLKASEERGKNLAIVVSTNKEVEGRKYHYYIPIATNWDWGYWRPRYQAKAIIYTCQELGITMHGYDMPSEDDHTNLISGTMFPSSIIQKIPLTYTWYPEDYISSDENIAKDVEERESVFKYFEEENYITYLEEEIKRAKEESRKNEKVKVKRL